MKLAGPLTADRDVLEQCAEAVAMANVLIVDDHPTNRRLLVTLLGYEGHHVIEAADGAEALPLALRERPDLIVTDIVMSTMDGVEFIRQLRAALGSDLPPVIFYSATYLEREARALAQASGVAYVVTKPTNREEFSRAVRVALSSKKTFDAKEPERETLATTQVLAETLVDETKQLERVTFRLSSLIESGLELAAERDPKRLLAKCVHAGREIIGAKYARIGVLGNDGHTTHYLLTSGMDPRIAEKLGPPRFDKGVMKDVLASRRPCRVRNSSGDPSALGLPPEYPPTHSLLAVPIRLSRGAKGWLFLSNKLGAEEFSDEEERIALALAAQVAVSYENVQYCEVIQNNIARLRQEIAQRERLEEQLRLAQRMEEARRLAGGVAHDFNNLVTIISGYCQLLVGQLDAGDPRREFVEEIRQAGDRATSLTRQLLAFSRRQVLQPQVLDLNLVIANAEEMLRRLIGEDIELVTVQRQDLGRVKADPGQIEQVIMNLVVNARDAMPKGGKLTIETAMSSWTEPTRTVMQRLRLALTSC